jgi:RNA polymerase sigma factor (sigma-70 family)
MSAASQGNESFEALLNQIRQGDEQAAVTLVETYGPYLVRAVRRTLRGEIRSKFDSNDFVQAVWASIFASPERLTRIEEPAQLVGLLRAMARNKVTDENRRRTQTQRRSVHQERQLPTDAEGHDLLPSSTPGPVELAIARENWTKMLSGHPEHYRQIARLKLMGKTNRSIAGQLGINEKTVRRVLKRLRQGAGDEQ